MHMYLQRARWAANIGQIMALAAQGRSGRVRDARMRTRIRNKLEHARVQVSWTSREPIEQWRQKDVSCGFYGAKLIYLLHKWKIRTSRRRSRSFVAANVPNAMSNDVDIWVCAYVFADVSSCACMCLNVHNSIIVVRTIHRRYQVREEVPTCSGMWEVRWGVSGVFVGGMKR